MAVRRSQNWINQQRVDTPHLRSIESAIRNDFDELLKSFVLGENASYVLRGFELAMDGAIGASANSLQLIVEEGSIFHATSNTAGTFFVVPSGTDNEPLSSTTNTKVDGSFTANALNYIGIEFERKVDDATTSQIYLWNPTSKNEITKTLPLAETLDYKIVITSSTFASNVLPISIVQTDASNNVSNVEDRRPMLFRLGTAGSATPNPFNEYGWDNQAEGRTENFWSSSSSSSSPFRGGDKQILTLKEWMDAAMSALKEIKGTTYWYSPNIGGSIVKARADIANTIVTGRGSITHNALTPGLINWSDDIFLTVVGSRLKFTLEANAATNDIVLSDNEVAYINLVRDQLVIPNLVFTQASAVVSSVGAVNWTADVVAGDYIRVAAEDFTKYYKILSVDSLTQVTLVEAFAETSTGAGGTQAMYAWGAYETNATPSTNRHIQTATRENVPFGENVYWILLRQDNADSTPNVYARFLGESIELGESQDINNDLPDAVKSYIGMASDSDAAPDYGTAAGNFQITTIESVPAEDIDDGQYFTINTANDAIKYYVWFNKDAGGSDPAPATLSPIEVAISTGDSAIQVSQATAAAIAAVNGAADFSVPVPTTIYSVVTNIAPGSATDAANVDVGGSFETNTNTQGFENTINSQQDYFTKNGENLTARISKLTSMMADKAQDRTVKYLLRGVQNISNVENVLNRDVSFSGEASPNKTLTLITPSTTGNVTITLDGTLSLAANQVAYFSVDRNSATAIADMSGLTVVDINAVPLDENIFIFAYRLSDGDVNLWNGQEVVNYQDALGVAVAEVTIITPVADVAGSLNNKYITINSASNEDKYYAWYNVNSLGVDPTPAGLVGVEIALATNATVDDVATATHAALNGLAGFNSVDNTGSLTVTNAIVGATDDATVATSGFGIVVDTQGVGEALHYVVNGDLEKVALKKIDQQVNANAAGAAALTNIVRQNASVKMIEGGTFSWDLATTTLTWSAPAQIQIAGLQDARNNILAGNSVLANDGDVAYVSVNRTAGPSANLAITVAQISSIVLTDDIVVIARRVGSDVVVGTSSDLLEDQEFITLDGSLQEINRYFGQLRLLPHPTNGARVIVTGSDITKLSGSRISQAVKNLLLSFDGAEIDFSTGEVFENDGLTALGINFTAGMPTGTNYKWYSVTLSPSTVNANNTINGQLIVLPAGAEGATPDAAERPAFSKGTQLGLVYTQGDGAASINAITYDNINQLGVGGGGSGGSGDANELLERLKNINNTGAYDVFTPVIYNSAEETLTDPVTDAKYDVANSLYNMTAAGEQFTSVQMLDSTFLSESKDVAKIDLHAFWNLDSLDTAATYEVSRDGGNEYQAVTMERIGGSDAFTGTHVFAPEASHSTSIEHAVGSADASLTFDVAVEKRSQVFTVAAEMTLKEVSGYFTSLGVIQGAICVQIIKDNGGSPSTNGEDIIYQSTAQDISGLAAGDHVIKVTGTIPLSAGDYHIVWGTDLEYRDNYNAGVNQIALRTEAAGTPVANKYQASAWSASTGQAVYLLEGRALDLRVRITSSADAAIDSDGVDLLGFGIEYDLDEDLLSTKGYDRQVIVFSGDDNINTFNITEFTPDPILLNCYEVLTGQVYRRGAWTIDNGVITFPENTFDKAGEVITLEFLQVFKGSLQFDSLNRAILAENHLGSANPSLDLSSAGRGIILQRPDGTLREIALDNDDNITISTVS